MGNKKFEFFNASEFMGILKASVKLEYNHFLVGLVDS
jgi:hypothetical protein